MKKIIKISVLLSVLLLSLLLLASCGRKDAYDTVKNKGYTVSVRFDVGDGMMDSQNNFRLTDVFNVAKEKDTDGDGLIDISLLAPDDDRRDIHKIKEISYANHYFAGWYVNPSKRKNDNGEYLDEYGRVCSEENAALIFEKRWDFSKDTLEIDPNKEYTPDEPVLTLYAAWIPETKFNVYAKNESGQFELLTQSTTSSLDIPQWNKSTGELGVSNFPTVNGKTFNYAYVLDENGEQQIITESVLTGNIDFEHGVMISDTRDIYTDWLDGKWYKIYDAKTLAGKADSNSNYIICADLDFSSTAWFNTPFARETFNGKIQGENGQTFKLKNIFSTVDLRSTTEASVVAGGVFKALGETAEIKNITFETVQLTVKQTPMKTPVCFGLLAGTAHEGATLENVTFEGTNIIKLSSVSISNIVNPLDRKVGLLFGNGTAVGIDMTNIDCQFTDAATSRLEIDIDYDSGTVYFVNKNQ